MQLFISLVPRRDALFWGREYILDSEGTGCTISCSNTFGASYAFIARLNPAWRTVVYKFWEQSAGASVVLIASVRFLAHPPMETVCEEREPAHRVLLQIEDIAKDLHGLVKSCHYSAVSAEIPANASALLNDLTTVSCREDAENLLASGVSIWNSAICLDDIEGLCKEVVVKLRHVAVDCMYMSITVLGGISVQYDIDELSLLKFYTICGRKYIGIDDTGLASVCFEKAHEFSKSAEAVASDTPAAKRALMKAMFDLNIGRAECAWEMNDLKLAEELVLDSAQLLNELPDEHEFLASVLYNFGLYAYESENLEQAQKWLRMSIDTRGSSLNKLCDASKQARTSRLLGVCALSQDDMKLAYEMMQRAESIFHDPVGTYFLLKLAVINQVQDIQRDLLALMDDEDAGIEVCMAAVALLCDAQRLNEAKCGLSRLYDRYVENAQITVRTVGPRYFEVLTSVNDWSKASDVLLHCYRLIKFVTDADGTASIPEITSKRPLEHASPACKHDDRDMWFGLVLRVASVVADQRHYFQAAWLLGVGIALAEQSETTSRCASTTESEEVPEKMQASCCSIPQLYTQNEVVIRRLAAACGLLAAKDFDDSSWPLLLKLPGEKQYSDRGAVLRQALNHAQRAKQVDPSDFASRILTFRLHLALGNTAQAVAQFEDSVDTLTNFDAGALAEAVCDAQKSGNGCVLTLLKCMLRCKYTTHGDASGRDVWPKGFFGSVFISAVNIVFDDGSPLRFSCCREKNEVCSVQDMDNADEEVLSSVLRHGLSALQHIGLGHAFVDDEQAESALVYVQDISWNAGKRAGEAGRTASWAGFFDLCHDFAKMRSQSVAVLHTRRIAQLQSATALIESEDSVRDENVNESALQKLQEVRDLTHKIRDIEDGQQAAKSDAIEPLIFVLEARCYAYKDDQSEISRIIDKMIDAKITEPGVYEQVAAVSMSASTLRVTSSDSQVHRLDNAARALSHAVQIRLRAEKPDLESCSVDLRELIGLELSRTVSVSRAYVALENALALLTEYDSYPLEEQRWLTATAWDTAQMLHGTGHYDDAERWAEAAVRSTHGNLALLVYVPRIEAFLERLRESGRNNTL